MSYQCFRLALAADNNHAESYNNLGVLEFRKGNIDQARIFFQTAQNLASLTYEPNFNYALLSQKVSYELYRASMFCSDTSIASCQYIDGLPPLSISYNPRYKMFKKFYPPPLTLGIITRFKYLSIHLYIPPTWPCVSAQGNFQKKIRRDIINSTPPIFLRYCRERAENNAPAHPP